MGETGTRRGRRAGRFLSSRRGAVAVASALLTIPMLGSLLLAYEAVNHHQTEIRLGRSAAVNAVLGAKEGPAAVASELEAIQTRLARFNTRGILSDAERATIAVSATNGNAEFQAGASYPYNAVFMPLLDAAITAGPRPATAGGAATAQRRRVVTEYAFVLDASASMREGPTTPGSNMLMVRQGLRGFANAIYGLDGENAGDDPHVFVSVVEYTDYVNVGIRYADRLVSDKSRRPPDSSSPRVIGHTIASEQGYADYLDPVKGPEATRKGAVVARKPYQSVPIAAGEDLSNAYAQTLELPPQNQADRFDLLIQEACSGGADCFPGEWRTEAPPPHDDDDKGERPETGYRVIFADPPNIPSPPVAPVEPADPPEWPDYAPDLTAFFEALGEYSDAVEQFEKNEKKYRRAKKRYDKRYTQEDRDKRMCLTDRPSDPSNPDYGCHYKYAVSSLANSSQSILVASNSRREVIDHVNRYLPRRDGGTGADEGMAWAYRTLHPAWGTVWRSASDRTVSAGVPHEFGPRVRKRLVLLSLGASNHGWFAPRGTLPTNGETDHENIKRFCQYLHDPPPSLQREPGDIEVTVILFESRGPDSIGYFKADCPSLPISDHLLETTSANDLAAFLQSLGRPEYEARLGG